MARVNHPGRLLGRRIKDKGRSQRKFAEIIGKSYVDVSNMINGKRDINTDFAIRFGIVFGTHPDVWLGMQNQYDIQVAYHENGKRIGFDVGKAKEWTAFNEFCNRINRLSYPDLNMILMKIFKKDMQTRTSCLRHLQVCFKQITREQLREIYNLKPIKKNG